VEEQANEDIEKMVRGVLRRMFHRLFKVVLTPTFHRNVQAIIDGQILLLKAAKREARRKKRSKKYVEARQNALDKVRDVDLGILAALSAEQLAMVENVINTLIAAVAGKGQLKLLDPSAFIGLQKKIFIPPQKRGPKLRVDYDDAYRRHVEGVEVSAIAREMDPYGFNADPEASMQKFRKAFRRRLPKSNVDRT
jgi:hypothetical protein